MKNKKEIAFDSVEANCIFEVEGEETIEKQTMYHGLKHDLLCKNALVTLIIDICNIRVDLANTCIPPKSTKKSFMFRQ